MNNPNNSVIRESQAAPQELLIFTGTPFLSLSLQALTINNPKNVIISPFSVKLLLTLLSEASGDRTKTQQELSKVIPFGDSHLNAREYFDKFFTALKEKTDDYSLETVTRIYADNFITPNQRYEAIVDRYYHTRIFIEDFSKSDSVSQNINQWVSNVTHGHISELVKSSDIDNAVMVMINAMYFKGLWRQPFYDNQTFMSEFKSSPTQSKQTQFMSQTGQFFYVESHQLQAKILRLPYKGQKFSMFLILPYHEEDNFDLFVNTLDSAQLHKAKWLMDETEVRVVLPKFKFDYSSNLNQVLQSLGIRDVFTDEASLPLLARGSGLEGRLKVSNIIQKAGLAVDEKGSTAFVATEVSLVNKFGDDGSKDFIANRPFMFMIEDEINSAILFSGKVVDPTQ